MLARLLLRRELLGDGVLAQPQRRGRLALPRLELALTMLRGVHAPRALKHRRAPQHRLARLPRRRLDPRLPGRLHALRRQLLLELLRAKLPLARLPLLVLLLLPPRGHLLAPRVLFAPPPVGLVCRACARLRRGALLLEDTVQRYPRLLGPDPLLELLALDRPLARLARALLDDRLPRLAATLLRRRELRARLQP